MALALAAGRMLSWLALPIFDDAFITFRYARNLALGRGFVYNPGEWVLGTTAPAFGLLLALPGALGLSIPDVVVAFNILCDAATLCLALPALARAGERGAATLFGAAFILSPIMGRVCVGGMEANLFLLAGLLAIRLYHGGRPALGVMIAALAYFLRPEALLLVAILCLGELLAGKRRRGLTLAAIALMTLLPGLLAQHAFYGTIIPQSVAAKSLLPPQPYGAILGQLLAPDPLAVIFLPLAILGAIRCVRRRGFFRTVAIWGLSYVAAYAIARPLVWPWYGEVTYFMVLLLGSVGLADLLRRIPAFDPFILSRRGTATAALLPLLAWGGALIVRGGDMATARVYRPLDAWCRTHTGPGTTIAAYDIGAIGYYSDATIYDLAGLVWPEAVSARWDYPAIVARHDPEYIYLFATRETARWMLAPAMRARYAPLARFSKSGATSLVLDTASFADRWVQDYILFEHRPAREGR
jgi:hypothetical protein